MIYIWRGESEMEKGVAAEVVMGRPSGWVEIPPRSQANALVIAEPQKFS